MNLKIMFKEKFSQTLNNECSIIQNKFIYKINYKSKKKKRQKSEIYEKGRTH